ncbi:MAG TPA: nuclear transport factor 2 family protein [Thermoleophilaceae bacterium]|jgi:steroid delta-isomerase-like uncharacterized protein
MADTSTATRTAEETVLGWLDAIAARQLDRIPEFWHPEGVQDWVALGVFRGHEEIRGLFEGIFESTPDFELTVERTVADEGHCVVQWRSRGTFEGGPFNGIEPTGRVLQLRGCDVIEVEDGRIVRNTVYYDGAEFARGVGMLPPQDSGAERAMVSAFNGFTRLRRAVAERI